MGKESDFAWDDGCMMQCAEEVLLSCTVETCLGFVNQCNLNKFHLKLKKQQLCNQRLT